MVKWRMAASAVAMTTCLSVGAGGMADAAADGAPAKKPPCAKAPDKIENLEERAARREAKAAELRAKSAEKAAAGKKAAAKALERSAKRAEKDAAQLRAKATKIAVDCPSA